MPDSIDPTVYNYTTFEGQGDFESFPSGPRVGSLAPDFPAILLETGQQVRLSDYWRERDVLVEFGSYTWPYCSLASPAMEPMAKAFAEKGVDFVFVYTREAHPGENYPAHSNMEQKLAHARAFREYQHIERPILVDDLSGRGHLQYGDLPNMTWLIGRGGRILFRSDWTDPPTIEMMLNYLVNVRARRRAGERVTSFYAEFAGFRVNDRAKFMETLKVAGPQAVEDFARMVKIWAQQPTETGNLDV